MTDFYVRQPLSADVLDPNETISHWRILNGREKSQQEINDERLKAWRQRYDAHVSVSNWRKYHQQSKVAGCM